MHWHGQLHRHGQVHGHGYGHRRLPDLRNAKTAAAGAAAAAGNCRRKLSTCGYVDAEAMRLAHSAGEHNEAAFGFGFDVFNFDTAEGWERDGTEGAGSDSDAARQAEGHDGFELVVRQSVGAFNAFDGVEHVDGDVWIIDGQAQFAGGRGFYFQAHVAIDRRCRYQCTFVVGELGHHVANDNFERAVAVGVDGRWQQRQRFNL